MNKESKNLFTRLGMAGWVAFGLVAGFVGTWRLFVTIASGFLIVDTVTFFAWLMNFFDVGVALVVVNFSLQSFHKLKGELKK